MRSTFSVIFYLKKEKFLSNGIQSMLSRLRAVLKYRSMEVITIEKRTWEQLLQEMQLLTARVEMLFRKCQDRKLSKWLDSDEVCELLRISPRTLQELRSKHRIGYAQIGRKFYYRPEEVELVSRQQGLYINKV